MFCCKCGAELPDDAKFCLSCGYKIGITIDTSEISQKISEASKKGIEVVGKFTDETRTKSAVLFQKAQDSDTVRKIADKVTFNNLNYSFLFIAVLQIVEFILYMCSYMIMESNYGESEKIAVRSAGSPLENVFDIALLLIPIFIASIRIINQNLTVKLLYIVCIISNAIISLGTFSMPIANSYMIDNSEYAGMVDFRLNPAGNLTVLVSLIMVVMWIIQMLKVKNTKSIRNMEKQ